ncbi:MAG TPA: bifunctional (p)ppGpp synthetase/guanosine-3',5'-bis(diphosphate) 3'-pyrophosphohydrolase [Hyphomicrobiaceae bacterium]|nr:bifunctional (p)ppGpp synthetase/guanosine-3',5'-bis(diphosphate) 3'-pyrophosphohydrolase [Hyphomicrobiaceae bacterium]
MMRQYELVERVLDYNPNADEALLNRAYVYAMKAHGTQRRASGDPYFSHPLEVAAILTSLKLDDATIATALLHDVVEDTNVTQSEIDQLFGGEIGELVDGLTKIKRLDLVSKKAEQAENFRKLLIAISSDVRVLLVKLADRLHNMRTLEHNSPESRRRNSEETLEIYAPLAGRMGMQQIREELEELSFRWLYPEAHEAVTAKLRELNQRNEGLVGEIGEALKAELQNAGITAEVYGRYKKPYSIWRKMENRQISLEQLSDIYGFRIVVGDVDLCYRALGVAHGRWRAVPGRFKDYISTPKQNNYQSIHTTIVGPRNQRVEMQIRTRDMHSVAELGIAAHALYKDRLVQPAADVSSPPAMVNGMPEKGNPYMWLRRLVAAILDGQNSEEVLEHTKLELFHDQVFCFTPKGRIIALPRGATAIDFAYGVHTDVGNNCIGAIINGRQMPLRTQLKNGDEVEILTAKDQVPPAAWEQIVVTGRARGAIRRAVRDAERKQYVELGRRLLASSAQRAGIEITGDKLKRVMSRLGYKTPDDVYLAIGREDQSIFNVLGALNPETAAKAAAGRARLATDPGLQNGVHDEGWFNLARVAGLKFKLPSFGQSRSPAPASEPAAADVADSAESAIPASISLKGLRNDIPVTFDSAGAVPGDRIVGVMSGREGIKVFQIHSPRLAEFEQERWIDVRWDIDPDSTALFPARILVTLQNEPGTLAEVARVIGEAGGNIDNLRMTRRARDFTDMLIEVEVSDVVHLNTIIAGLRAKDVVSAVERVFD